MARSSLVQEDRGPSRAIDIVVEAARVVILRTCSGKVGEHRREPQSVRSVLRTEEPRPESPNPRRRETGVRPAEFQALTTSLRRPASSAIVLCGEVSHISGRPRHELDIADTVTYAFAHINGAVHQRCASGAGEALHTILIRSPRIPGASSNGSSRLRGPGGGPSTTSTRANDLSCSLILNFQFVTFAAEIS